MATAGEAEVSHWTQCGGGVTTVQCHAVVVVVGSWGVTGLIFSWLGEAMHGLLCTL